MFIRVLALLIACVSVPAFGGVTISPSHTDLSYDGVVRLTASVGKGAAATIDIFFDSNQNGSIDTGEPAWRRYSVTDGQPVPPTGALMAADTDGLANGTISVPIMNFAYDDRIGGRFVVRVTSGSSTSKASFINDPPTASQSVAGQLQLDGTGKPGAAFLMSGSGEMMYPVLTDSSGKYTLPVTEAGSYLVGGMILGEAGRVGSGVAVTIASGQKKTGVNVAFTRAPYRLKGKVVRSDNGVAVPYTFLDVNREDAAGWVAGVADASGNFDIGVGNGTWSAEANAAAQIGFMGGLFADGSDCVTISGASVTGKNFFLTPVAGFVSGRARNSKTLAYLAGAKLLACLPGTYDQAASATSDASGYWALGVAAGQWDFRPMLDTETDLYKTMLYPSTTFTKTITAGQAAQSIGTVDFLPADGTVSVKVVDYQNHAQPNLYVYGCDLGISNSYQSNAGPTDANGRASVPIRRDNTWFVGVNTADSRVTPPQRRLDVLALDGNTITIYPLNYRKRPYRVYGGNSYITSTNFPQDAGYKLLGKAAGTATFWGSYPYYCIVSADGGALVDSVRGLNGTFYGATASNQTLNADRIAGKPDGKYATVGDAAGTLAAGSVLIQPAATFNGITVYHPDEWRNGADDWRLYR
ncbi:MAG: hypothetical protein ABFD69_15075 [Candidatus Sumerlaeia bacterium]